MEGWGTVLPHLSRYTQWECLGWAGPPLTLHPLSPGVLSSVFLCPPMEGWWSSKHRPNRWFLFAATEPGLARLLTYFEELRAPLAQGWPPTHTP